MPSADFCPAVRPPFDNLSRHRDTEQISWGKLNLLPCAAARATTVEVSRTVSSAGKVLRQKTQVNFGGAGLPLSELSNVAGGLRETPTPVTRHKVGRNEPCPCGRGKKFKKCCGGG